MSLTRFCDDTGNAYKTGQLGSYFLLYCLTINRENSGAVRSTLCELSSSCRVHISCSVCVSVTVYLSVCLPVCIESEAITLQID